MRINRNKVRKNILYHVPAETTGNILFAKEHYYGVLREIKTSYLEEQLESCVQLEMCSSAYQEKTIPCTLLRTKVNEIFIMYMVSFISAAKLLIYKNCKGAGRSGLDYTVLDVHLPAEKWNINIQINAADQKIVRVVIYSRLKSLSLKGQVQSLPSFAA